MKLIQVDQEKCTRCGFCVQVCPVNIISRDDNQWPQTTGENCIACGHCVAICPKGALDNVKAPLLNQIPLEKRPVLDADTAAHFLRSRRSIRTYKDVAVPQGKIHQLLDIARLAPTGGNSQGISYYVFNNPERLGKIIAVTIDWMELEVRKNSPWAPYFVGLVDSYRKTGQDVILRGAPCLIVAISATDFQPRGRDNTHFSLAYAELYAPTIELGTCWAGLFEVCAASGYLPMLSLLGLPENMTVTGALMVGYPKYTYQRLVERNPLKIIWKDNLKQE